MAIDVNLVGNDRRHVLDLILKAIESRKAEIRGRDYYYYRQDQLKVLHPSKLSKAAQAQLAKLQKLDDQVFELKKKINALLPLVQQAIGKDGQLAEISRKGAADYQKYSVRETPAMAQEREEGNEKVRKKKLEDLSDLHDRVLLAAANGDDLAPFIEEMRKLGVKQTA